MKTVNTNRLNQLWKEGVLPKIKALLDDLTESINGVDEKIDVLDTKEEIEANTDEEKMAGALAVKGMFGEINSKLINIKSLNFKGVSGAVYINAMLPTIILFAPCTSPGYYTQLFLNIYNMWYVYLYKADGSLVTEPVDVTIVVGSI